MMPAMGKGLEREGAQDSYLSYANFNTAYFIKKSASESPYRSEESGAGPQVP